MEVVQEQDHHVIVTGDLVYKPHLLPSLLGSRPFDRYGLGDTCKDLSTQGELLPEEKDALRLLYGVDNCDNYQLINDEIKTNADSLVHDNFIKVIHTITQLDTGNSVRAANGKGGEIVLPNGITKFFRDCGGNPKKIFSNSTVIQTPADYTDPASRSEVTDNDEFFPQINEIIELKKPFFDKIVGPNIMWFKARINTDKSCDIRFKLSINDIEKIYGTHIVGVPSNDNGTPDKNGWPAYTPYPPTSPGGPNFPFPGDDLNPPIDGSNCFLGNNQKRKEIDKFIGNDKIYFICALLLGKEVFGDISIAYFAYLANRRTDAAVFTCDYMLAALCLKWYVNYYISKWNKETKVSKATLTLFIDPTPEARELQTRRQKITDKINILINIIKEVRLNLDTLNKAKNIYNLYTERRTLVNIRERSGTIFGAFNRDIEIFLDDAITILNSIVSIDINRLEDVNNDKISLEDFRKNYKKYTIQTIITNIIVNNVTFSMSVCNPFKYVQDIVPPGSAFLNINWPSAERPSATATFLSVVRSKIGVLRAPQLPNVRRREIYVDKFQALAEKADEYKQKTDEDEEDRTRPPQSGGAPRSRKPLTIKYRIKSKKISIDDIDIETMTKISSPTEVLVSIISMFVFDPYVYDYYDTLYYLFDTIGETCFHPTTIRTLIDYILRDNRDIFTKYNEEQRDNLAELNDVNSNAGANAGANNAEANNAGANNAEANNAQNYLIFRTLANPSKFKSLSKKRYNKDLLAKKFLYKQLYKLYPARKNLKRLLYGTQRQLQVRGGQRKTRRSKRPGKKHTRKI